VKEDKKGDVAARRKSVDRNMLTPEEVRPLVELMNAYGLTEVEVERSGVRIKLRRDLSAPMRTAPSSASSPLPPSIQESSELTPAGYQIIEAPMVGTFYCAPAPDAPPFVKEGDSIKEGQTLCVIEAMKLMNEIEAKVSGRIVKILVENGQPVEYGQPLFHLEPL
jgi:acetyl-CoA carboxylase biotin carboxyl carrier protein